VVAPHVNRAKGIGEMGRQSGGAPFPPSGPAPRRHFAAGRRARNRL